MLNEMQTQVRTAGETAKITLVIMRDCHVGHNQEVTVKPEDAGIYRRLAAKRGWLVGERKPKEPTYDNCDNMTIRQTGSGNHRHCDLLNLYIPDNEMFPSCSYHKAIMKFERKFESGRTRLLNTIRKGGRR